MITVNGKQIQLTSEMSVADYLEQNNYQINSCLLYTSDAADEEDSVDLGRRCIIKKKQTKEQCERSGHNNNTHQQQDTKR